MRLRLPSLLFSALLCVLCGSSRGRSAESFDAIKQKIVSFKLDNGLTVILCPRGFAPVITCVTYVRTGGVDEAVGDSGIAHQLEHLAFKGTRRIGVTDAAAEEKVLGEIDALYEKIQATQKTTPPVARQALLALLAKWSMGGPAAAPDKIAATLDAWLTKTDADAKLFDAATRSALKDTVTAWAAKVQEADKFVIPNQYAEVIGQNGGTGLNAFTSNDRTVYHVSLPSNRLELWAALETDRFMNLFPRQLEKEKQVVLEERRMRYESNPGGMLYLNFLKTAYEQHFYGRPVIGYREDILDYTREHVLAFYRAHYRPDQTIVAIAGDVDIEKARHILTDYFGKIPVPPPLAANAVKDGPVEPPQTAERRVDVPYPAEPNLRIGWHIPERANPDTPALNALAMVAGTGRSSRMYSTLVKSGIAVSAGCGLGPGERYPRLFMVSGTPGESTTLEQLESALIDSMERFKTQPPTTDELKKAFAQQCMGLLDDLNNNMNLAVGLADYQAIAGDWHEMFKELDALAAVTPAQVQAVAVKYFTKENRIVARLVSTRAEDGPTILGMPVK